MIDLIGGAARRASPIPKFILLVIPKFCSLPLQLPSNPMRMPLPCRCECAFHGSFGVALIGSALVHRQRAALAVRKLSFFKPSHSAAPAAIESELCRKARFLAQPLNQLGHAARRIKLRWLRAVFCLAPTFVQDHWNAAARQFCKHVLGVT
jgi:hypothetical protein